MKHLRLLFYTVLISITCLANTLAQESNDEGEVFRFNLNQAVDYAIENNYSMQNAKLDIVAAKKEIWKTTAIGLPQASGSYDYQYIPGDLPTLFFPDGSGGMREVSLGVKSSATYGVTVSQLIFSGEYIVGLQAAKTYLQISKNALEKTDLDTRETVTNGYYSALILKGTLETIDSSISNLNRVYLDTKAMYENGLAEETDVQQFEVSVSQLKNARKATERQLELSYMMLKTTLGMVNDQQLILTQDLDEFFAAIDQDYLINTEIRIEDNIEYKILENQERISELSVKREKAKFLPSLSGFYRYSDKTNKADFDITFNHILGFNLSVPILSSGQRLASVQKANVELKKSINNRIAYGETVNMLYEQVKKNFLSAYETYQTQKRNIELTNKIYENTIIKYNEGMASSLEVSDAHRQYLDAIGTYTQAISGLLTAKTALERAYNDL